MNPIELLNKHCKFDRNCVYILMAIARKKDHPHITCSTEIVFREIIRDDTQIARKFNKLKQLTKNYEDEKGNKYNFYIYVSVNPRNTLMGWQVLQKEMSLHMYELLTNADIHHLFRKIDNLWCSALAKECCAYKKLGKKFVLDIDTKDKKKLSEINDCLRIVELTIDPITQETRNGYHYVTNVFDKHKFTQLILLKNLKKYVEVKTDGMLFLDYINNKED